MTWDEWMSWQDTKDHLNRDELIEHAKANGFRLVMDALEHDEWISISYPRECNAHCYGGGAGYELMTELRDHIEDVWVVGDVMCWDKEANELTWHEGAEETCHGLLSGSWLRYKVEADNDRNYQYWDLGITIVHQKPGINFCEPNTFNRVTFAAHVWDRFLRTALINFHTRESADQRDYLPEEFQWLEEQVPEINELLS